MKNIKIGDKVVCIDDTNWVYEAGKRLTYRSIYTVLDITTCKKCNNKLYDLGCKREDKNKHSLCCQTDLVGAGIDWVGSDKLLPYRVNFINFCRKEIVERIYEDIESLIKNREYEKAIETIKRLENIENEL